METTRIQTGKTERIEALVLDGSLNPLTGKTDILLSIRRGSDGLWFDFADLTFKAAGWTTRQQAMTEVSATNDPGAYGYAFNTATITNPSPDDTYFARVDQSPGTDAANLPATGELKVGDFVDDIDSAISSRAPADEYDTEMARLDVAVSSRAPADEYDVEMARLDVAVSSRAPADEYDVEMARLDVAVSSRAVAGEYTATMAQIAADTAFAKDIEGGRWHLTGGQMIFYKADNVTEVARFNIILDGNDNPIERTRV
jgi:hypothetical protein